MIGIKQTFVNEQFTSAELRLTGLLRFSSEVALADQVGVDRPRGIRAVYEALRRRLEVHEAEHVMLECLGEALWRSQREGGALDATSYLEGLRQRVVGR